MELVNESYAKLNTVEIFEIIERESALDNKKALEMMYHVLGLMCAYKEDNHVALNEVYFQRSSNLANVLASIAPEYVSRQTICNAIVNTVGKNDNMAKRLKEFLYSKRITLTELGHYLPCVLENYYDIDELMDGDITRVFYDENKDALIESTIAKQTSQLKR